MFTLQRSKYLLHHIFILCIMLISADNTHIYFGSAGAEAGAPTAVANSMLAVASLTLTHVRVLDCGRAPSVLCAMQMTPGACTE